MERSDKDWNPKGGRPKKQEQELKNRRLNLCFTKQEMDDLQAEMKTAGYQRLGIYAKTKLLSRQGIVRHNPKELFVALNKLGPELNKIGGNINQIAKYVNYLDKNNIIDPKFIVQYNEYFQKMIEVQQAYVVAIRAYLRSATK